ncbi:hypothetical protein E4K72_03545 [Oxalobacteraceae bacterium OM1]|nr:hypothetical protein E4K72_03545 [Oxalobacteraceae bacterium OM1]
MQVLRRLTLAGWPAIATAAAVWLGAVLCLIGTQSAVRLAFQGQQTLSVLATGQLPKVVAKSVPLTEVDYKAMTSRMIAAPGISIAAGPAGITVDARALADYETWYSTVSEIMLSGDGVAWELKKMCTGECQGSAFVATIVGMHRTALLNT